MDDTREKLAWGDLELKIQKSALKKDGKFILRGKWKKFVRKQNGFKVYKVDGEWVRNNLLWDFEHGGHGFVHLPVPMDEIWVDVRHYEYCPCLNVGKDRKMSEKCFESTVIHEIAEFKEMKKGMIYWDAHQVALQKEREAGILEDPYIEYYT